ncbi:MAG: tryptophan--tRNA ligase [Patescibacteria group bacterium]
MTQQQLQLVKNEYQQKKELGKNIRQYYLDKTMELNLKPFKRIKKYLESEFPNIHRLVDRDIIFAHLGFESFTNNIAEQTLFSVISGLNPSAPLHLGHKVLFDLLLFLQKLGADIYIPLTNDESYIDGKVASLAESRRIAYEEIIPSIIAFGFDPRKTKIFVMSDYPEIYNFAMLISKNVIHKEVVTVFGEEGLDNSGKAFYRSAVQLAQILLLQLPEFGGRKETLIPVGIDQHPYILLARDVARKMGYTPPSELMFKFQNSLLNPFEKMSGSKSKTAIYFTDTPEAVKNKIHHAFTGSISLLEAHKKFGGIPEACSVFSLLYFHHPDNTFVQRIYDRYRNGTINMDELKEITTKFITQIVKEHREKKQLVSKKVIQQYLYSPPLQSFL